MTNSELHLASVRQAAPETWRKWIASDISYWSDHLISILGLLTWPCLWNCRTDMARQFQSILKDGITVAKQGHGNKKYGIYSPHLATTGWSSSELCNYTQGDFKDRVIKRQTKCNKAAEFRYPWFHVQCQSARSHVQYTLKFSTRDSYIRSSK
jgi:hypothetical protein